jgi:hypothetical protein
MDRVLIVECGHPNPLGCPNHGAWLREIVSADRYDWIEFEDLTPLAYDCVKAAEELELTDQARAYLRELTDSDTTP